MRTEPLEPQHSVLSTVSFRVPRRGTDTHQMDPT